MFAAAWLSSCAQLLWPARCAACDAYVAEEAVFCDTCAISLGDLGDLCPGCALPPPLPAWADRAANDDARCARCRRVPFPFARADAAFPYGEALATAIIRMKHGGRRDLARRFGRLLAPALRQALGAHAPDLIVPVPLHASRLRRRGFNQALEIVRGALAARDAEGATAAAPRPAIAVDNLRRVRATRELGHAGPAARLAEVAGAFAVADPSAVRGRRVLLVDDVFTTGATFTACTETLRRAGADAVHVLALARAV